MIIPILIGLLAAILVYAVLKLLLGNKTSYAGLEPNTFQPYDALAVCPGLHKWQETALVFNDSGESKNVLVCVNCGVVSGYQSFMLTKNALDKIKTFILVREARDILLEEQVKTADKLLKMLEDLEGGVTHKEKVLKIVRILTDYEADVIEALDKSKERNK